MGNLYGERGAAPWHMKLRATAASALLALLFLIVYPLCNWITSLRTDVGTWYFGWERSIPFIPFFILPYMSIDLFFLAAPFLCADAGELRTYARRTAFAILAGGACFLLFPLKYDLPRPVATGWLGAIFNPFLAVDRPYNLVPCLHITLRTVLAETYRRHSRGITRVASEAWFFLIALSPLFTWQHHVMDVVFGFVLAWICFWLFREERGPAAVTPNARVGGYYAVGAVACLAAAPGLRPWGALLVWPALALGVTASAYFGAGPGIYAKKDGRLPLATRILLAPVLAGQWLSLYHYRRQCHAWDEIVPGLWLGRRLSHGEAADAVRRGVRAVLDLTGEFSEAEPFLQVAYRNLPIMDLTAPTRECLDEAIAFIRQHAGDGIVYVHCKIGYSRSAAVVGAYLTASGLAPSWEGAVTRMREARPSLIIRPEALRALREYRP